jgi:hypothetical protein
MTNQQLLEQLAQMLGADVEKSSPEPVQIPVPDAKPSRAERKAANKKRYASLNGFLASATKAAKDGEDAKATKALTKAYTLASEPTVWTKEQDRVVAKAEALGYAMS